MQDENRIKKLELHKVLYGLLLSIRVKKNSCLDSLNEIAYLNNTYKKRIAQNNKLLSNKKNEDPQKRLSWSEQVKEDQKKLRENQFKVHSLIERKNLIQAELVRVNDLINFYIPFKENLELIETSESGFNPHLKPSVKLIEARKRYLASKIKD